MDLEEQILRYYSNLFKYFLFIFIVLFLFYFIFTINYKKILKEDLYLKIDKGSNINLIFDNIFQKNSILDKYIYFLSLKVLNKINKVHYGAFNLKKNYSFYKIYSIIAQPSNVNLKITIVEGWQKYQLEDYLSKHFLETKKIDYDAIIADTYLIKSANNFESLLNFMVSKKKFFENENNKSNLLKKYTFKELMIIASLVEKEAKNNHDKKFISSVIFNRLEKNMKLQIDASVIFALTNGNKKFDRKLLLSDLKYQHPYNTYHIRGLPPDLISYVGIKTIEIVLENYKTDFLFYYFDKNEDKHIFTKNYSEHKLKLNEYRKTKK